MSDNTHSANHSPGPSGRQTPLEATSTAPDTSDCNEDFPATEKQTWPNRIPTTVGGSGDRDSVTANRRPMVTKRHAQDNWPNAYHQPKSVKPHKEATPEVIPEPPRKRPLQDFAIRMAAAAMNALSTPSDQEDTEENAPLPIVRGESRVPPLTQSPVLHASSRLATHIANSQGASEPGGSVNISPAEELGELRDCSSMPPQTQHHTPCERSIVVQASNVRSTGGQGDLNVLVSSQVTERARSAHLQSPRGPVGPHMSARTGAPSVADRPVPYGRRNSLQEGTAPPSSFQHSVIGPTAVHDSIGHVQPPAGYPPPPSQLSIGSQQVQHYHDVNGGQVRNGPISTVTGRSTLPEFVDSGPGTASANHYPLYNHQQTFGTVRHGGPSSYPSYQVTQCSLALSTPATGMSACPPVQAVYPADSGQAHPFRMSAPTRQPTSTFNVTPRDVEMEEGNTGRTTIHQGLPIPVSHAIRQDFEMVDGDTIGMTTGQGFQTAMYRAMSHDDEMVADDTFGSYRANVSAIPHSGIDGMQTSGTLISPATAQATNSTSDRDHTHLSLHQPPSTGRARQDASPNASVPTMFLPSQRTYELSGSPSSHYPTIPGTSQRHAVPATAAPSTATRATNSASGFGRGSQAGHPSASSHYPIAPGMSQHRAVPVTAGCGRGSQAGHLSLYQPPSSGPSRQDTSPHDSVQMMFLPSQRMSELSGSSSQPYRTVPGMSQCHAVPVTAASSAPQISGYGRGSQAGHPSFYQPPSSGPSRQDASLDLSVQTMSLVSQRMSELIATMNRSTIEHSQEIRQLRTELQSQREDLADRLHAVEAGSNLHRIPPNDASAMGGSAPGPRQRRRKRPTEDPYRGEPHHQKFRRCIERHLLHMLKITDYTCLDQLTPPPSDDDITAFKRRQPGCITITPDNFHIDLSRSRDSAFNIEAIRVFAEDFRYKVITAKWYHFPEPPPPKYVVMEYIELCLYLHLRYVKEVHNTLQKPLPARHEKLKKGARSTRKTRLFQSRADCVTNDNQLVVHNELMQLMLSTAMSSDESDPNESSPQKSFRRITPAWRSRELGDFLHSIDDTILFNRRPRVGHRAIRGQDPRRRKHTILVNQASVAPPKLPYNCYDAMWLDSLRPSERRMLQIQLDKKYNFSTGAIEQVPIIPSGTHVTAPTDEHITTRATPAVPAAPAPPGLNDSMDDDLEDFTRDLIVVSSDSEA